MPYTPLAGGKALQARIDRAIRNLNVEKRGKLEPMILGDNNYQLHPIVGGKLNSKLWLVRPDLDSPSEALPWSGLGAFKAEAGEDVLVGYHNGTRCVIGADTTTKIEKGINPNVLNTGDTRLHAYMDTEGFPRLQCRAIGTNSKPSTVILVNEFLSFTDEHTPIDFRGGQVDLAAYIPATGMHRLAHIFLQEDGTLTVTTSTAKNMVLDIDATDYEECILSKPARAIPSGVYKLRDAQTAVTEYDKWYDGRQFFRHEPPRMNWSAIAQPAFTDDEDSGYGIGSQWIYSGARYICTDATAGAAKWHADCMPLVVSGDYTTPAGHVQTGSMNMTISGTLTIAGELILL